MKACEYCGYTFEHEPAVCKLLIAEKKEKPIKHMSVGPHGNKRIAGNIGISRENILKLERFLKGEK